jgi:hypothetical protein
MKLRTVLYAGVAMTALLAANSAMADVFVQADITKTKDITVTQNVTITKTINLDVLVSIVPGKAAEADGIINQVNTDNEACGNCAEKRDEIINSIGAGGRNTGIINVNQSSGNMNNQGNAVSVAVDAPKDPPGTPPGGTPPTVLGASGFANSQAHIEQVNGEENEEGEGNLVDTVNLLFRDAVITNSINNNLGIVNVNQSAGSMNNQANLVAVAVSLVSTGEGGVALAEADLGQVNRFNEAYESDSDPTTESSPFFGINKSASIGGSIVGNRGIVNVNQGAGNMANQANNVSAAAVVVR